jgi:hypothetical protein
LNRDVQRKQTHELVGNGVSMPKLLQEENAMNALKRNQIVSILVGLSVLLLVITSCPNPINEFVVGQMVDKSTPSLTISDPDDNSQYTQTVTVQGIVSDAGGEVRHLRYRVAGALQVFP